VAHDVNDARYREGIRRFNEQAYFEAHEIWEELWREDQGSSRRYYQGLIQAAVCLYHFGTGNTRGARKLYFSSRGYLEAYRPRHLGVDVDQLLVGLERCCAELAGDPGDFPRVTLRTELIPRIDLDPLLGECP
jgi:uncharacterized protein